MNPRRRGLWGTRFGFYLAAIGSAFGLGNLWRFPYITVENGGGAFVLLYFVLALVIGLPLLIGELMLGKISHRSVLAACKRLPGWGGASGSAPANGWHPSDDTKVRSFAGHLTRILPRAWVGRFALFCCVLILSYYAVISGWVLHFLMQFFFANLTSGTYDSEASLRVLRENGLLQIALTSVHLLLTVVVVAKGVQEGLEKWVSNAMPVFVLLLVVLVTKSMSLPSATQALRFLFYPDFSKLTAYSMLHAVGHVFFTLSIGFGTMVTFGSYLNQKTHIPSAGFRVAVLDTAISLFAGLLIFPVLIAGGMKAANPELLFQVFPRLLLGLDYGFLFGMSFFMCLYLASLGASIGLMESLVANVLDAQPWSRARATWVIGGLAFALGIAPALSSSTLSNIKIMGSGILEVLDAFLINVLLPISALGIAVAVASRLNSTVVREEFLNDESIATQKLYPHWLIAVGWIAPAAIVLAFVLAIFGLVRSLF